MPRPMVAESLPIKPARLILGLIACIGLVLTLFTLLFGFTSIPANSIGVKTRFGAFHDNVNPGLAYAIPYVDEIQIVPTQRLLKLEFGDSRGGQIGADLGQVFGAVVEALQETDQEFGSLTTESSALLRALVFQRMDKVRERLKQIDDDLSQREQTLLSELDQLDALWTENPAQCREPLAQNALRLTFIQKWLSEVRERKIRLEELA